MFLKLVPSLLVLSALCGSYAAPSDDGVAFALSRLGVGTEDIISATTLGSDSSGHTSYSILLGIPAKLATASTATGPDTTITAAVTLVEGSTDAHMVQAVTAGGKTVATGYNDCAFGTAGFVACTYVEKNTAGSVIESTMFSATLSTSTASATSTNGAGQVGVVGALGLSIVAAGVTLVGAMV